MPTPREIALATNQGIEPVTDADPAADFVKGEPKEADYRVNPTNPPEPAAPFKG